MDKETTDARLLELQASICQTFSNPWRLRVVEVLAEGEMSVTEMANALGIPKAKLSQHLAIMRDKQIVQARRSGGFVYYSLTDPKILQACRLMRQVLLERLKLAGHLVRSESLS